MLWNKSLMRDRLNPLLCLLQRGGYTRLVARGEMNLAFPFQDGSNASHHEMSTLASALRRMWFCRHVVLVLRMIRRQKKSCPRVVVDRLKDQRSSSWRSSPSLSARSHISYCCESSCRIKKMRAVMDPSTFSIATCTPSWVASLRKSSRWTAQAGSPGGLAMQ